MDKKLILEAIGAVRKTAKKRAFKQTFDLVINLKGINVKTNNIDSFVALPYGRGKRIKICAFVDKELLTVARNAFDKLIAKDQFPEWKTDKKKARSLAKDFDFFVAQADIMPQVAMNFGTVLGPRGKMPNPKMGCIIPSKIEDFTPLIERLRKTVRLITKNEATIKCPIGDEDMKDGEIAENADAVISVLIPLLPQEKMNVKDMSIKLTMSAPIKVRAAPKEK